jgi:IMP dehydrogenase
MLKIGKALCFDDILLVPQKSSVSSRHDVDLSMSIGFKNKKVRLSLPVIAAPMDTVCDTEMCIAMHNAGGMGILHRYMSYQDQILKCQDLIQKEVKFGVALASNNGYLAQADHLYNIGVRFFLVDTANGHGTYATKAVAQLRNAFKDAHIMAGNVSTKDGFLRLAEAGADSVRVGIGGGSACTTRLVSGHGVPTLQSIMDCAETFHECSIVADGGIRTSGDMVKAFAAGADAVMIGSMLAGTDEAPGEILISADGREVKASASAQKDATGTVSVAEGISTTVPYKGSASHILNQIRGGLGSGCSYTGVEKLSYIEEFSEYVTVSPLTVNESIPHANMG